jgi:hypothetical protein
VSPTRLSAALLAQLAREIPQVKYVKIETPQSADKLRALGFHKGERDEAAEDWEAILPLIHFENRQCGLRATKALLKEGGIIGHDTTRSPLPDLPPHARHQLVRLAEGRDALILRWA